MISNVKVYGLEESIRRSKFPMTIDPDSCTDEVVNTTKILASSGTGEGHDQFLTGIIVQFDLDFTIKAWTEAERYHFFDFVSSMSTMHRIAKMDIRKQCCGYVTENTIKEVERLRDHYMKEQNAENYLALLYNIPVGLKLTAGMTTNYRQLKTIYFQRRNHRLPEWRAFCQWIERLPMFKELVLKPREVKSDAA